MTRPVNFTDYSSPKSVASTISGMWDSYNSDRADAMALWKEVDAYRFATDTKKLPGGDNFDHTTHIPVTHMVDEKLGAILNATAFPHEDWLGWKPLDRDANNIQKRKNVLAYLRKLHAQIKFTRTGKKAIDDLKAYGNTFLQTAYVYDLDEEGKGYVGPKTFRISPYNIVFDPTAPTFDDSFKIVLQRMTVGEFALFCENHPDHVDGDVVKQVLERRIGSRNAGVSNDYYKDGQFGGQGYGTIASYYRSGFVDVLWFYGSVFDEPTMKVHRNRCIAVVDYDRVLLDKHQPNSYIRKGSWKERPDNLWAQSPLEVIIGLNYMINHRENAKNDAIDKMIYPDQLYIGDVEILHDEVTGRREIWAPLQGGAQDITPDASTLSFNTEIDRLEQTVMEATGLPSDILGFRSPGEKTAFEVQNLTEGAFRGFIDHVAQFEQDCLEKVVRDQIEIASQHYSEAIKVMGETDMGNTIELTVTKDDLDANAALIPQGARRFTRMLQQLAGLQSMSQYQPIVAAHVNTFNFAKAIEELSGLDDFQIVSKFAAMDEQAEMQKEQMLVQQDAARTMSEPSSIELAMEAEDDE